MSDISFTKEQQQAIKIRDKDILVSAAAGAGKTAVLVERIIRRVLNEENPIDVDRMLIVTHTNAAAAEMKRRLTDTLLAERKKDPQNKLIQNQLRLVGRAQISTMSSFCLLLVRRHFYNLGIDPGVRVADETEIELLQQEVLDSLFEDLYKAEEDYFLNLLDYFNTTIYDDQLKRNLLSGHHFMKCHPWPQIWQIEQENNLYVKDTEDLFTKDWYLFLHENMKAELESIVEAAERNEALAYTAALPDKVYEIVKEDIEIVKNIQSAFDTGIDEFIKSLNQSFSRFGGGACDNEIDEEIRGQVRDNRSGTGAMRKGITKLADAFPKPIEDMIKDINNARNFVIDFHKLLNIFEDRYQVAKEEKSLVDYSDLEHFALQILLEEGSTPENMKLTKEATVLREQFDEIYIDEYQDINMVQELILLALSGKPKGEPNRFMVGDIKQSIYRFRLANPEIFTEKYNSYPLYEDDNESKEVLVELSKNFRSRDTVLSPINDIFDQIMSEEIGEVEYNDRVALYPGASYPETDDIAAELHLIEGNLAKIDADDTSLDDFKELTKDQVEAGYIANEIETLVNSGFQVKDGDSTRPIQYKDIVVLLRTTTKRADLIDQELTNRNIPAYNFNAEGYFEETEIMTILNVLSIIDNPMQDIPLVSVLYSPIVNLTPEDLYLVASEYKNTFYDSILSYVTNHKDEPLAEKLLDFLNTLHTYQEKSLHTPIHELLWYLLEDTGYFDLVGAMPGGALRQSNLLALFEHALQYEQTNFSGLFHFVKFIDQLKKQEQDLSEAKVLSEQEDVVRIMSIHKSKGLEFPVVFVANTEKGFNFSDMRKRVIEHEKYGFGFKAYDKKERMYTETLHREAMKQYLTNETISEELRILYVALTRAEEKFYLTAIIDDFEKVKEEANILEDITTKKLPYSITSTGRSYLDFIIWSLARHKDSTILRDFDTSLPFQSDITIKHVKTSELGAIFTQYDSDRYRTQFNIFKEEATNKVASESLKEQLNFIYPFIEDTERPSLLTVSDIKRRHADELFSVGDARGTAADERFIKEYDPELDFSPPEWDKKENKALSKGTAMHTFLENLDIKKDTTKKDIENLKTRLLETNIMDEKEAELISTEDLLTFATSDFASRMRKASTIYKELPFSINLPKGFVDFDWDDSDANTPSDILLHGIIDCVFIENNEIILVDYKTDKIHPSVDAIVDRYKTQMAIYKLAISKSLEMPVKEVILYLFDEHIPVPVDLQALDEFIYNNK